MAIPEGYKHNFETMMRASENGDLCLAQCRSRKTGEDVFVVCATFMNEDNEVQLVPLAKMFDGNPYEEVDGPSVE